MTIELTPQNAEIVRHLSLITGERYDDIVNELIDNLPSIQTKKSEGSNIPNNATNGDVIKTMFPNAYIEKTTNDGVVFIDNGGGVTHFNRDWWNAYYKAESEEQE